MAAFERHPFGFTSDCFTDGAQFLKVWRHGRPPTDVGLLDRLAAVGVPVPTPITTATIGGYPCALFPYVVGRHATDTDRVAVAQAMRIVHDTPTTGLGLINRGPDEASVTGMRALLDHPWIANRRDEVARTLDRLELSIERARHTNAPLVLCHNDFGGWNVLVEEETGEIAALLDWDHASLAPREDDLWVAFRDDDPVGYLDAYGADVTLDCALLERALLARSVRDAFARVSDEIDRDGVDLWGFDQWRKVDDQLALVASRNQAAARSSG
jgi:aminoglycoside phosphotransferase (APT) family kinase protein